MRTLDFVIAPAARNAAPEVTGSITRGEVESMYRELRPALQREAEIDRRQESCRGLLYPNTLPEI